MSLFPYRTESPLAAYTCFNRIVSDLNYMLFIENASSIDVYIFTLANQLKILLLTYITAVTLTKCYLL